MKILTSTSSFADHDRAPLDRLINAGFEVVQNPYKRKLTKQETLELLPGVVGSIAGLESLDREVLEKSSLKVISRVGVGLSNIDLKAAEELGIAVCSTPDAPTNAVAELTIAGILDLLRNVSVMNESLHKGVWSRQQGLNLQGKTVLIIGFGRIGQRVAQLLKSFGVKLLIVDPLVEEVSDGQLISLEEGLVAADIVTLHCSGEKSILGEKEFSIIKKGAYIVNIARGELIDETVLIKAIENGIIAGAFLDTFIKEPYEGPLAKYPQVLMTPHTGSFTKECRSQMEMEAVNNLLAALNIKVAQ